MLDQIAGRGGDMSVGRHGDGLQDEREDGRSNIMVKWQFVYTIMLASEDNTLIYLLLFLPLRTQVPMFLTSTSNRSKPNN